MPAAVIVRQQVDFQYAGQPMSVVSDYRTPLYDTVAEVMEYDCYQLCGCDWTDSGGGIVVDAGANVGVSALALAGRFPGRIICLEPVPENLRWLQENLASNGAARAEVWPVGLAGCARRDWLWRDPEQSVSAHFNADLAPGVATSLVGTEADPQGLEVVPRVQGHPGLQQGRIRAVGRLHEPCYRPRRQGGKADL